MKLYVLVFNDASLPIDFKVYGNFLEALNEYIAYSIQETRNLLDDSNSEDDVEKEEVSCVFQILQQNDATSSEYKLTKEYDIDYFLEKFLGNRDDMEEYLNTLEGIVCDDDIGNNLPEEVLQAFPDE